MAVRTIERTALHPFTLAGETIPAGRVVKLTREQFVKAVAAGTVYEDGDDNAGVPIVGAAVDHDALDTAAGNAAHAGPEAPQSFVDPEAARRQAASIEAQRLAAENIAKQAEIDAAAKREADLEAEKARKAEIDRENAARAAAEAEKLAAAEAERVKATAEAEKAKVAAAAGSRTNAPPAR